MTELAPAGLVRAMTAFVLLAPGTPMLFMGQEFGATTPFRFFADHSGKLAADVHRGRRAFLSQFASFATPEAQARIPDPADPETFSGSRLDHGEQETERGRAFLALHRDLLRLRRETPAIRHAAATRVGSDAAVLTPEAFVLRFFDPAGPARHGDRLLVVNMGSSGPFSPAPEPLLAPPDGSRWRAAWTSDAAEYGGPGSPEPETADGWRLPARAAVLLEPILESPAIRRAEPRAGGAARGERPSPSGADSRRAGP
jgi:maltooligosyltrehalose trehalohydrolase